MPRDAANHPRAVSGAWRRLEELARRPTLRLLALLLASRVWGVGLRLPLVALQATRRMGLLVALEVGDLALRATLSVLAALGGWGAPGVVAGQALGGLLIALVALAVYAWVTD